MRSHLLRFLLWLGRLTKTDVLYLVQGNFWLGMATVITSLSSFGLALAFGNLAAPETYGTYRFLLSYISILGLFGMAGFSGATVRATALGYEGEFRKSFRIQALTSLIGSAVALGFSFYYFSQGNQTLGTAFIIIAAALPLIEPLVIYNAFLTGRQEFRDASLFSALSSLIAVSALLLALYFKASVVGLVATYCLVWIGVRFFFYRYTIKKYRPTDRTQEQTSYLGKHFSFLGILNEIASYIDRIAIFHFLGAAETAVYSFAIAPTEQVKGFFKNISTLSLPRFSERSEAELKRTMIRKMLLMGAVALAFIVPFILLAPTLFDIFLPQYRSSVLPAQIFMLSLLGVTANLPVSAMKALSKVRSLYITNIFSSILTIGLVVGLTLSHGLMGAIVARLFIRIFGIFFNLFALYYLK